jgi:DNA polymerase
MTQLDKKSLLEWYIEAGVDEATADAPVNYFATAPSLRGDVIDEAIQQAPKALDRVAALATTSPSTSTLHHSPAAAGAAARELADACQTLEALEAAVRAFDGCAIKKTANKTVFSDGNPKARVMIIGEAPGGQEDIKGIPFCGPSGLLLDRMLAAIGLDRTSVYISNTVFWRPPGNRQPSIEETGICLPFVEKHIALVAPALLILSGGTATNTLLKKDQSISRLRGKFYDYSNGYLPAPIPTTLMYHPSYLLRSPLQKRLAWADLLMIKKHLNDKGIL